MNHGQSHYPQMEKTCNSGGEPGLYQSRWATKITPRAQRQLIQEVIKEPRTTSKELQASIKASVHDSTIRKRLDKNGIPGRVPRQRPLLTKNNTKAHLAFDKKYLDYPQEFWANILWTDATKVQNFLEDVCLGTSGVKPTQHFIPIIPIVKHGGGSVLCSFRT